MALSYEPTIGESIADALYDGVFGINPLIGVGVGAIGARVFPRLVTKYMPTQAENAGLIGAGLAAGLGAAMFLSPKTKGAALPTIVAAVVAGPISKWIDDAAASALAPAAPPVAPPAAGAVRDYFGATGYDYLGQSESESLSMLGVGATTAEPVGLLGDGGVTAPPLDVLSGAFGSNFMTR